jgi:(p)ppGpp synthase/HD superfamily hydrolase
MELTSKTKKARDFAETKHEGQLRKGSDIPYFTHPDAVAKILAEYTDDEDIISAGYLHDVLEDVEGYTYEDLSKDFSKRIANIVNNVTHQDGEIKLTKEEKRKRWKKRKQEYVEHLKKAPKEALLVCAADKIHNLETIIEKYKIEGEEMWGIFNAPEPQKENVIWYYEAVLNELKELLNNPIVKLLEAAVDKINEEIRKNKN